MYAVPGGLIGVGTKVWLSLNQIVEALFSPEKLIFLALPFET